MSDSVNDDGNFETDWEGIKPSQPLTKLPVDDYVCEVEEITYAKAGTGSEGVQVIFKVIEGQYAGKLTPAFRMWLKGVKVSDVAKKNSARDLQFLGLTSIKQMDNPPKPVGRKYVVTISRDNDHPLGKVYMFVPKE